MTNTREILFRGKRIDNGEWAYGYYWEAPARYGHFAQIYVEDGDEETEDTGWVQVEREAVSQFTGITDRNGIKIFEHDTVCCTTKVYGIPNRGTVCFVNGWFCICTGENEDGEKMYTHFWNNENFEITGNIHERKEGEK